MLWAGPFYVSESIKTGTGLLKDWSNVRSTAKKRLEKRRQERTGETELISKREQNGTIDAPAQIIEK
jgi:hypothetical protein